MWIGSSLTLALFPFSISLSFMPGSIPCLFSMAIVPTVAFGGPSSAIFAFVIFLSIRRLVIVLFIQSQSSFSIPFSIDEIEYQQDESNKSTSFPSAVMAMKTLFFSEDSPMVETLPTFAVGTLREVAAQEEDEGHELTLSLESFDFPPTKLEKIQQKEHSESAVVLPTEIFLVNLYGSVYCVELGSLGSGQGVGLTKLDREAGCIHVRHQVSEHCAK